VKVLVDTCIWSVVLRRHEPDREATARLGELIAEGRVLLIGPIRQEVLSGVPVRKQFRALRDRLAAFEDMPLHERHYETAAEYHNRCRAHGVQGSHTDFLICAVCTLEGVALYTADTDFQHYRRHLSFALFS